MIKKIGCAVFALAMMVAAGCNDGTAKVTEPDPKAFVPPTAESPVEVSAGSGGSGGATTTATESEAVVPLD